MKKLWKLFSKFVTVFFEFSKVFLKGFMKFFKKCLKNLFSSLHLSHYVFPLRSSSSIKCIFSIRYKMFIFGDNLHSFLIRHMKIDYRWSFSPFLVLCAFLPSVWFLSLSFAFSRTFSLRIKKNTFFFAFLKFFWILGPW